MTATPLVPKGVGRLRPVLRVCYKPPLVDNPHVAHYPSRPMSKKHSSRERVTAPASYMHTVEGRSTSPHIPLKAMLTVELECFHTYD